MFRSDLETLSLSALTLAAGSSGGLSGAVLSPGTPGPGEVPRRYLETVSPLSCPPPLPLYHQAGLCWLSVELGLGGQQRDGHAVSPPLPVCPRLGENHQGAGSVSWLNREHQTSLTALSHYWTTTLGSNYEGIFSIILLFIYCCNFILEACLVICG